MEKNNGSRLIAVLALGVAVAGLSLGFAAFSTSLKVDTAANVSAGSNWNVGFSTNGTAIEDVATPGTVSANETGNPGELNVTKYTIAQKTNANLSTTAGSKVTYDLKILNKGSLPARLESVNFGSVAVTCTNGSSTSGLVEGVAGAGTTSSGNTSTISNADCAKMFRAKLKINSTTYDSTPVSIASSETIAAGSSADVTLTVEYIGDAAAKAVADTLDGDIIVNIGSISVGYTSTAASGS